MNVRRSFLLAPAVAVCAVVAGCSSGQQAAGPAQPSTASLAPARAASAAGGGSGPQWLLTRSALSQLLADPGVRDILAGSTVYELLQPGQRPLPGFAAEPVVTFSSLAVLRGLLGHVPPGTYGVLYDPEAWSFTPAAEQADPVAAASAAAGLAHAHHLKLLVAPALNLTTVMAPGSGAARWQEFLRLRLAARMARVADVLELQAQSLERDTSTYAAFVREATAQSRAANPGITILAGLSTNPPGAPVGSADLTSAIRATRDRVDGYWLNIPGQGPRCPTCNPPAPEIGMAAIRSSG